MTYQSADIMDLKPLTPSHLSCSCHITADKELIDPTYTTETIILCFKTLQGLETRTVTAVFLDLVEKQIFDRSKRNSQSGHTATVKVGDYHDNMS